MTTTGDGWEYHCFADGTDGRALFDAERTRRYCLIRRWGAPQVSLTWIMLNPSTAGADVDDPTIRKCVGYAKRWAYGGIRVLNLFSLISTDPDLLRHPAWWETANDARNDDTLREWLGPQPETGTTREYPPAVIVAWGANGRLRDRDTAVAGMLHSFGITPLCLGTTRGGQPLHPGRTAYDLTPVEWKV